MNPRKLTVKQLLAKFPAMLDCENTGCLHDIACPNCGNRDEFRIRMSSVFSIADNGTDGHEDTEWDENSYCGCPECLQEGKVRDFTFKGLDCEIYNCIEQS